MGVGTAARVTSPQTVRAIPPDHRATVEFNTLPVRDGEAIIENCGPGACVVDRPDGQIGQPNIQETLPPGEWLRLAVPDAWDTFIVTITAAAALGTTVRCWVDGEPVPMVRGRQKVPQRDPQTGLITHVLESDTWVPKR